MADNRLVKYITVGDEQLNVYDIDAHDQIDRIDAILPSKLESSDIEGFRKVTISTEVPTDDVGDDGDLWLVYEE